MMKLSKMKIILVSLMVLVLAAVPLLAACAKEAPAPAPAPTPTSTPTPEPEVVHWKFQCFPEAGTLDYKIGCADFCDLVETLSNGRFIIEPFPGGAIVPNTEMFTAVSEGIIDLSGNCPFYYMGIMPVAAMEYGLPFTTQTRADYVMLYREFGYKEILEEAYAEHNVISMAVGVDPGVSLISTKPVRTMEDLQGLKVRAGGGMGMVLGKAGAAVTYISGGELYTSLATGVVEAAVYGGATTADTLSLQEVAKYWTNPYLQGGSGTLDYLANLDSYNALSDDLKAILQIAAQRIVDDTTAFKDYDNVKTLQRWGEEYGVEAIEFPASERAKMAPYVTEVLNEMATQDPYCARAAEALTKFMEFKGYW